MLHIATCVTFQALSIVLLPFYAAPSIDAAADGALGTASDEMNHCNVFLEVKQVYGLEFWVIVGHERALCFLKPRKES